MPALRHLPAAWRARPEVFSRRVWTLALALDRLPWPLGEQILGWLFLGRAYVRTSRLRQARAWAAAHTTTPPQCRRLARALCLNQGRFIARFAFVGIRDLATWRRLARVRGDEHLVTAGPGAILLNFHLGPIASHLALRAAGHRLTWVGGETAVERWLPELGDRDAAGADDLVLEEADRPWRWARILLRARRLLLDGHTIFVNADGGGREAFVVPLPGGSVVVREGWLALRRATGAPVLPVLSHLEGPTQIVTIHPPLPALDADRARDLDACREAIGALLGDYVRRFPEQCCALAFSARL